MALIAALADTCGQRLAARFGGNYAAQLWAILAHAKHVAASSFIPPVGEIEELTRRLERIAAAHPNEYAAHMMLGAIYRELPGWPLSIGDDEKSLELLTKAAALAPDNAELLLELAATQAALDNTDAARATYERAIQHGTGDPDLAFETAEARAWAKKMLAELD